MNTQSKKQGFSLVELMISVSIFAVVMLLMSGIIVNGLRARNGNDLDIRAHTYANSVLEQLKKHWSTDLNYNKADIVYDPVPSEYGKLEITAVCVDVDGSLIDAATCATTAPPLRRVSVQVLDRNDALRAELVTEIGTPKP